MSDFCTPLCDMLTKPRGVRFHMPGHKGKADFPFLHARHDMTELPDTDDLFTPIGAIKEAQDLAARAFHANNTIFSTGGATAGIVAMLLYALKPGERLITSRGVHNSVISGCIFGDIMPAWVDTHTLKDGTSFSDEGDYLSAIEKTPGARAVLVTRPDYYGRCVALQNIVKSAHLRGMRVLIDEAHGAHLPFMDAPLCAMRLNADISVASAHKTLPALTGGAYINMNADVDPDAMRAALRLCHTSSPSYLIMASLDWARAYMQYEGEICLKALCAHIDSPSLWLCECDPTRLVFDLSSRGITGWNAARRLHELGFDVEMADERRVVAIVTALDELSEINALRDAIGALSYGTATFNDARDLPPPNTALSPRMAALSASEWMDITLAKGRIAAASVGAYPPGIPILFPGERVTEEIIEAIAGSGATFGMRGDGYIRVVSEVFG